MAAGYVAVLYRIVTLIYFLSGAASGPHAEVCDDDRRGAARVGSKGSGHSQAKQPDGKRLSDRSPGAQNGPDGSAGATAPNIVASPANVAFAKANLAQLKPKMDAADGVRR
jgi:hypothetical protein